ncbi:butyrate kinase [Virgibacillus siamensis]|uniref:butyrate kinase n=1 Tax=Virgibacillus siamensis TaxID=480071 RepID=UPI000986B8F0|nr:butyrate kinase [Virgibacillus siamensis]
MAQEHFRVLVINPHTLSTTIGVFDNHTCIFENTIQHNEDELRQFQWLMDQSSYRKEHILNQLDNEGINISRFNAVCGRGGLLRPIQGGTYKINEIMLRELKEGCNGEHVSNLGAVISNGIAEGLNIPSYIVDPIVVDEMDDIARISGVPEIPRKSIFHALNQKAAARRAAKDLGKTYPEARLIVAHMGGGVTIGAHREGKVVDVNNGLDGEGPFSPERAGTVPSGELASLCFSGNYYREDIMKKLVENGGLKGYLHTNSAGEIEKRIDDGDPFAMYIYDAMAYQIAKEIGAMAAVFNGDADAIVLTGNLAFGNTLIKLISDRVKWIADIMTYPGENELQALNEGVLRVLSGKEAVKTYPE